MKYLDDPNDEGKSLGGRPDRGEIIFNRIILN